MGSVIDKLNYLEETKNQLKDSLIAKGASITDETPLSEYAPAIENIQSGGGAQLNIAFGENPPEDTSKLWVGLDSDMAPDAISAIDVNNDTSVTLEGWQSRILNTHIPIAATYLTAAVVGSKVYLFGGSGPDGYLDTINVFDSETETITTLETKLQGPDCKMAAAVVGTDVYLFGGANDYRTGTRSNLIQKFDTETEILTQLDVYLPNAEIDIDTFVFGNKIYLFGGTYGSSNTLDTTIRTFDTKTGELVVSDIKYPNTPTTSIIFVSVGSYAWIKYKHNKSTSGTTTSIVLFDPVTQTFLDTVPWYSDYYEIPEICIGTKLCAFGRTLYAENGMIFYSQDVTMFDYEKGAEYIVSDSRLPFPYRPDISVVVENKVYLFGGISSDGTIDTIVEFNTDLSNTRRWSYVKTANIEGLNAFDRCVTPVAVGTKIYLFGGTSSVDGTAYDRIAVFDTITGKCKILDQHLAVADHTIGTAVIGKTIYLTGGNTSVNSSQRIIQAFDTETETISVLYQGSGKGSYQGCAVRVGDCIYMFTISFYAYPSYSNVIIYNTITKTFTIPQWDDAIEGVLAAIPVGDKIYVFGDRDSRDIYILNTVDNTLSVSDIKLPRRMSEMTTVIVGDQAYLLGGRASTSSYDYGKSDAIFRFDMRNQTIVELDVKLPRPEIKMGVTAIGNKIYMFRGNNNYTNDTSNVYILDTEKLNNPDQLLLSTSVESHSHTVTLLNSKNYTLRTPIGSVYTGSANGTCTKIPAYVYENGEWVEI